MDKRSNLLAFHDALQVAYDIHVEDIDGQIVILAHADSGQVHHLQIAGQHLGIGDVGELRCCGILFWVGSIDAIDAGALDEQVGFDFEGAEGRSGVGGEERVAGAAGEEGDVALFQRLDGGAPGGPGRRVR